MRIAIDAVGAKHGGAATVLLEILRALLARPAVEITVFCSPASLRRFELPRSRRLQIVEVPWAERGPLARVGWHLVGLPRATSRAGSSVLLCLGAGGIGGRRCRTVAFVQQALPFSPEAVATLSRRGRVRARALRLSMRLSCARAARIVVQTRTMRETVAAAFRIPRARVEVLAPCVAAAPAGTPSELVPPRSGGAGPCLAYVGTAAPYKNLAVLPPAMALVRRRHPGATLYATLPPGAGVCSAPGIVGLGTLDEDEVRALYRGATALVLPSLVETVGLPLLEAAAVGTPAIVADRPYAREVCGESALYFDPASPVGLADAIDRLLSDGRLRETLSREALARDAACRDGRPYAALAELLERIGAGASERLAPRSAVVGGRVRRRPLTCGAAGSPPRARPAPRSRA